MKQIYHASLYLLILFHAGTIATGRQSRPLEKASIEGGVFRSGSGEPLGRAQVTIRKLSDRDEAEIPPYLMRDDGKFLFQNLEPGQYELSVGRNGYSRQIYGQRIVGGPGGVISLAPGQALKNVTFRLVQGGSDHRPRS